MNAKFYFVVIFEGLSIKKTEEVLFTVVEKAIKDHRSI